ncbi:MAG: TolC family protein [Bacteroidales bacterium]|nr:TolC family protein [Bacteroidales bacterium]
MKFYYALIFYFFLAIAVKAQNEKTESFNFSLKEAIDYALINNTGVKNAELDILSAKKEVWKTTAIGLPHASGALDYQHIPGTLPTFDFPNGDGTFTSVPLGVKNTSTYSVTVSQLVFSGEYIVGLQAAKTFLELSENASAKSILDTKTDVTSSYYTILVLEKNKEILDTSALNLNKTLIETKALVSSGFMEDTDYDQILIAVNSLENSSKAVQRQIDFAYLLFKVNLGIGIDAEVSLTQNMEDLLVDLNMDGLLMEEFILENNIDYQILATQEKVAELNLKREKSKFLPSLSAFYLYTDKTNKAAFDFTINHIAGLSVALPIFSSGQRMASVNQAKIEVEKSKNNSNLVGETLIMAVEQAKGDFKSAWEKYQIGIQNVELSEKVYNKTLIKYKNGVASSMEVTQANSQFLESNSGYSTALIEMLNAKTALEKALNNL